jgi:hypothetical protein
MDRPQSFNIVRSAMLEAQLSLVTAFARYPYLAAGTGRVIWVVATAGAEVHVHHASIQLPFADEGRHPAGHHLLVLQLLLSSTWWRGPPVTNISSHQQPSATRLARRVQSGKAARAERAAVCWQPQLAAGGRLPAALGARRGTQPGG